MKLPLGESSADPSGAGPLAGAPEGDSVGPSGAGEGPSGAGEGLPGAGAGAGTGVGDGEGVGVGGDTEGDGVGVAVGETLGAPAGACAMHEVATRANKRTSFNIEELILYFLKRIIERDREREREIL